MKKYIYLDNAATTYPKPEEVYVAMDSFYRNYGVNVGRGQHSLASKASSLVEETRKLLLELFNCPQKKIIFAPSATESMNVILQGINWQDGFTVYITPFEHNAVLRVLNYLKSQFQISIVELAVDKEKLEYDIENIKYQFQDKRPDILVINHASNVCGLIAPIKEICELSKGYNAVNVIDMAQTVGLVRTDLSKIAADYVVFAGHKTLYGPFGIAGFIMDKDVTLKPLLYGGTGVDSANPLLPEAIPERFEVGSQNIQAIAGLNAAIKWVMKNGIDNIRKKEVELTKKLIDMLNEYKNINLVGDNPDHIGIVSCVFKGYSSDSIGQVLNQHEIAVRTGLHCAPSAHKYLGTFPGGTVRFSLSYFNSEADLDALNEALEIIAENS